MLASGELDRKATVYRRGVVTDANGVSLGDFAAYGAPERVAFRNPRGGETSVGKVRFSIIDALMVMGDSEWARTLGPVDRVMVDGQWFEIVTKLPPSRGEVVFVVHSIPGLASYEEAANRKGETITLRRIVAGGPNIERTVRGIVSEYDPDELVGGINQIEKRVVVLAADVEASGFPVPFRTGGTDKVVLHGRVMNIQSADDSTHRVAGDLLAYELRVMG